MKTKIKFQLLLGTILSSLLLLTSCQTYTTQNKLMRNNLYTGNINQSIKDLDKSDLKTESRNIALYNMEKGMLLYLNGDYETAVKSWVKADKKLEELYTKSITKTAATYTINDELNDYTGETHERILLPLFSSIAFMAEGNSQNATTMIRRTYDLVLFLNSQHKAPSPENDYFTHYFSAVIFEYTGQWDSALVELRKSIDDLYKLKANKKNINVAAETEILQTAGRIASYRHRQDILTLIKKYKENIQWSSMESTQNKAEIFIVYECGFSPVKVSEFLPVIQGKDVFRIPFPAYVSVPYKSRYADIMVDHKFKTRTIVMENIGKMAEDALSQRRLADITRATSRVFLRKQLAAQAAGKDNNGILAVTNFLNNIIEVADTRSWTSLPDNIQVARLWVTPNITHKIQIIPEGQTEPIALDINLTAGQKKFFRFRTFH